MLTGKVVQFDEGRGYGFITPDSGGEDVFVHVNTLGSDRWSLAPGVPVEFEAMDSGRGPKALTVRVIGNGAASDGATSDRAAAGPTAPPAQGTTEAASTASTADLGSDEGLCDIVSERAFRIEITEMLLSSMPDLTAAQVITLRQQGSGARPPARLGGGRHRSPASVGVLG